MEFLSRHYGLDWLAVGFTMAALYRLGSKRRDGFAFGMASNLLWLTFGLLVASSAMALANVVFFTLNLRGFLRWRPPG